MQQSRFFDKNNLFFYDLIFAAPSNRTGIFRYRVCFGSAGKMFSRYYHRNSFNLSRWNIILLNSILLLDVRDTTQVHILVCCSQSRRADSTECECFCSLTAVLCCWMWKQFDFFFNFVRWDSLCCDCDDDDDRAACRFPEINGKNNTNFLV